MVGNLFAKIQGKRSFFLSFNPRKDEAQTALFKDPVRTAL
jgi:hypothetical protein